MNRRRIFATLCLGFGIASLGNAQEPEKRDTLEIQEKNKSDAIDVQLRAGAFYFQNFLQATSGAPQRNVVATQYEVRIIGKMGDTNRVRIFGLADQTSFRTLGSGRSLGFGVDLKGRPSSFSVLVRRQFDRPAFLIGNVVETSDLLQLDGEYGHRVGAFEIKGLFDYYQQTYARTVGVNNDTFFVGTALRFRGLGYAFSPEFGIRQGRQDTADPLSDYSQTELLANISSVPSQAVYLSVRYRYRLRSYDLALADNGAMLRQDNRNDFRALASFRTGRYVSLDAYYAYENADSLRLTRVYTTKTLGFGLNLTF